VWYPFISLHLGHQFLPESMLLSTHTEQDLLNLLSQDNILAFKELYDRYWHKMYLTALKKTQSNEVAEELVQEIFAKIWERRQTLAIENIETYLFTALKYAVISHIRTLLKSRQNENIETHTDSLTTEMDALPQSTWDLQAALDQALRFLPDKTRLIFEMSRYDELPHREIASQLDISEKAVEYHITQALKLLRVQLKDFMV
jgi:RNA polymerase sigma-70 factor (family 1)